MERSGPNSAPRRSRCRPGEPFTLTAYSAGPVKRAYIEPTAVGHVLIEMPLFLEPEIYMNVPLEETYMAAYRGLPALEVRARGPSLKGIAPQLQKKHSSHQLGIESAATT